MKVFLSILVFISVCFGDAFDDGLEAYNRNDYKKAFELYTLAANQGKADAQYNLGVMYEKGQGVTQDYKKAVELYTLASNQGYSDAQLKLGVMYANGQGVKQDYKKAKKLFRKVCAGGFQNGCDNYKILNQKGY